MNSRLRNVLLWQEPRISAAAFVLGLCIIFAFSVYNVLVVLTGIAIPVVAITVAIRVIFAIKSLIFKQPNENPFEYWLNEYWGIEDDRLTSINRQAADIVNNIVLYGKEVVLVKNVFESLMGVLFLYVWYMIGKNISGISLLLLGYICAFTLPKIYKLKEKQINKFVRSAQTSYNECYQRILDNFPILNKYMKVNKPEEIPIEETKETKNNEESRHHKRGKKHR